MRNATLSEINMLASEYQTMVAKVRVERYEVAVNSAAEASRTQDAYLAGRRYDPQFEFEPVPRESIREVSDFRERLDQFSSPWLDPLRSTVGYILQTLLDGESHSADAITARTSAMYGEIAPQLLGSALEQLTAPFAPSPEAQYIDASATVGYFRSALESVGLTDWSAIVEPRMNAMMDVSGERREIRVRDGSMFSRTAVARLLVHEIGCHVFRSASGSRQPVTLLGYGLGDYLPTEEGLGCWQEEQTGLSDPADSRRLALRYLAAARSLNGALFDVYSELREYADHAQAFETAARAKRGFADTTQRGSHLKDKVYFEGFRSVTEHVKARPGDLASLYVGKISLSMLPLVDDALRREELVPGAFGPALVPTLLDVLPES